MKVQTYTFVCVLYRYTSIKQQRWKRLDGKSWLEAINWPKTFRTWNPLAMASSKSKKLHDLGEMQVLITWQPAYGLSSPVRWVWEVGEISLSVSAPLSHSTEGLFFVRNLARHGNELLSKYQRAALSLLTMRSLVYLLPCLNTKDLNPL